MPIEQHLPEVRDPSRAPYNFIPLNETVVTVPHDHLPERNRFHTDRLTGIISCQLTTLSPIYVAGRGRGRDDSDFFHHDDPNRPIIPASSLRGMIRNLVEIITYSKMQPVTKNRLFFRDINNSNYQARFVRRGVKPNGTPIYDVKVKAGFLRKVGDDFKIECCEMARVDRSKLPKKYPYGTNGKQKVPDWSYQNTNVWVNADPLAEHFFPAPPIEHGKHRPRHDDLYLRFRKVTRLERTNIPGLLPGTLVITGDMKHKHIEFVFLHNIGIGTPTFLEGDEINEIVERLESDEQLSRWQERAFPKDQPSVGARRKNGGLRDGEPIFYLLNDATGKVEFIGRAQLFRLPFGLSPYELLPEQHRQSSLDMAEAIFGRVDGGDPLAGRVYFTDAVLDGEPADIWLDNSNPVFKAMNLASPKPTAYRHYLAQPTENARALRTYQHANATLRGFKMYWHQGRMENGNPEPLKRKRYFAHEDQETQSTQDVWVKPIRHDLSFTFQIYFENLSKVELGGLLWALSPPSSQEARYQYCHKLGMGKPLGMGSVHIELQSIQTVQTATRYDTLFDNKGWQEGWQSQDVDTLRNDFEEKMKGQLNLGEAKFIQQKRIQDLLQMLRYPGIKYEAAKYMPMSDRDDRDLWRRLLPGIGQVTELDRLNPPPPPQPVLVVGDIVRGNITSTTGGDIEFSLYKKYRKRVPHGKKAFAYIPYDRVGTTTYLEGNSTRAVIEAIVEDEDDLILQCRPATEADQEA